MIYFILHDCMHPVVSGSRFECICDCFTCFSDIYFETLMNYLSLFLYCMFLNLHAFKPVMLALLDCTVGYFMFGKS